QGPAAGGRDPMEAAHARTGGALGAAQEAGALESQHQRVDRPRAPAPVGARRAQELSTHPVRRAGLAGPDHAEDGPLQLGEGTPWSHGGSPVASGTGTSP